MAKHEERGQEIKSRPPRSVSNSTPLSHAISSTSLLGRGGSRTGGRFSSVFRRSLSFRPMVKAHRLSRAERIARSSSETLGPWNGKSLRRRLLVGCFGKAGGGGDGGRLRVAVASNRDIIIAL